MKSITRKLLIWCLAAFSLGNLRAQSWQSVLQFGDSMLACGNYRMAEKAFLRAEYFATDFHQLGIAHEKLGNCYYTEGKYVLATDFYGKALLQSVGYVHEKQLFKRAQSFMRQQEFTLAMAALYQVDTLHFEDFRERWHFNIALCYWGLSNFVRAEQHFCQSVPVADTLTIQKIHAVFSQPKRLDRPNPQLAAILSFLVPGAGQLYVGEIGDGLNSLFLTGSLAATGVHVALKYTVLDAFLSVYPWFARYHKGGRLNARKQAEYKRGLHRQMVLEELINILLVQE